MRQGRVNQKCSAGINLLLLKSTKEGRWIMFNLCLHTSGNGTNNWIAGTGPQWVLEEKGLYPNDFT